MSYGLDDWSSPSHAWAYALIRQVLAAASLLIVVAFLPQIRGCTAANAPKVGRVVDETDGRGLPGVTVIASAHFYADGILGGSASNYAYRYVTQTNAGGNFVIPIQWAVRAALPGTNAHEEWLVTALEPGYVLSGDEIAWQRFDAKGRPENFPPSTTLTPPVASVGFEMKLAPMRMRRADLTLGQFATYYRNIQRLGDLSFDTRNTSEDENLRRRVSEFLTPKICALSSEEVVPPGTAEALLAFATDQGAVNRAFHDVVLQTVRQGNVDSLTYQSGQICQLMMSGDTSMRSQSSEPTAMKHRCDFR